MKNLNHVASLIQQNYTTIKVTFDNTQRLPQKRKPVTIDEDYNKDMPDIYVQSVNNYDVNVTQGTVRGQGARPRSYTYKCPLDVAKLLEPGMLVIVPESEHKGVQIGTVVAIDDEPDLNFEGNITYKWIIGAVNTEQYDRIIAQEQEMIRLLRESERVKAREELLNAYQLSLPEGSEARKLFDQAAQIGKPQSE